MKKIKIVKLLILCGFPLLTSSQSTTIVSTLHNLSVSGPGSMKATSENEICVFCHTPHNSRPLAPLWNRDDPGSTYTLYNSTTINATLEQPDGASILCLSCHDGTIALGNVFNRTVDIDFSGGITTMTAGNTNLTTDLSDDHPVSFVYNADLAASNTELNDPAGLILVKVDHNEKLQCTSCHDPHKSDYPKFLLASTQNSNICKECHNKAYWDNSSHNSSNASWNGTGSDPWFHTAYESVSDNACENCHNPHNAGGNEHLLKYLVNENNCLDCHNGNVADPAKNIQTELTKTYTHDVFSYDQIHDASEAAISQTQHVECEDCHNPHATRNVSATAPAVKGFNEGTRGVDQNGNPVVAIQYEYELCYRCHAESPSKPVSSTQRQIEQNNVRLEFDLSNPSYHPVVGQGKNTDVPSLISPLTESSIIYCTDCHASDGTGSPKGPHGSIYPQIMKYKYERDVWDSAPDAYELCYQCHESTSINTSHEAFGPLPVTVDNNHAQMTSCNTCHDPHGISSSQGNSTNNAYLVNFNTTKVSTNISGEIKFTSLGAGSGTCSLNCHSHDHVGSTY